MFNLFKTDNVANYKDTKPTFSMENYFNGPIKGWGIIQDWKGQVISRFDIELIGTWNGDKGELKETFVYYDGSTQKRTWQIIRKANGTYEGRASDIIGKADGQSAGGAANWRYHMDLQVDNKTYRLNLDDWMWQMNDGVLINRIKLKKFGFTAAELTVFMQKQDQ